MTAPYGRPPGWYPDPGGARGARLAANHPSTSRTSTKPLWWSAGGALAVFVVGLAVVLVFTLGAGPAGRGGIGPLAKDQASRPPLAKLCPPPTAEAQPPSAPAGPAPAGARVTDTQSGISYAAQPAPWKPWDQGVWSGGTLEVEFRVGYYFVTEQYVKGDYLASVLSGAVPATVNDGLTLDLRCTGRQVAEDVRISFYPEPNRKQMIRDEQATVGGRPAWVSLFRLSFSEPSLDARSELVGVVLVDVGRPEAAVLYISIPDTHRQYEPVAAQVIDSLRPI